VEREKEWKKERGNKSQMRNGNSGRNGDDERKGKERGQEVNEKSEHHPKAKKVLIIKEAGFARGKENKAFVQKV
jgi:hypothetical protein